MKKALLLAFALSFFLEKNMSAAVDPQDNRLATEFLEKKPPEALPTGLDALPVGEFLSLTPAKYRAMTGKKLGWKQSLALRAAQKSVKKQLGEGEPELTKGLYVVIALFAMSWIVLGVRDDWHGRHWRTGLFLSLLCCFPGIIYGFVVMRDYFQE